MLLGLLFAVMLDPEPALTGDDMVANVHTQASPDWSREWIFSYPGGDRPAHMLLPPACGDGGCPFIVGGDMFSADSYLRVVTRLIKGGEIEPVVLASLQQNPVHRGQEYRRPTNMANLGRAHAERFERHMEMFAAFIEEVSVDLQPSEIHSFGFSNGGEFAMHAAADRDLTAFLAVSPMSPDPQAVSQELRDTGLGGWVVAGAEENIGLEAYARGDAVRSVRLQGGHEKAVAERALELYLRAHFGV